jgi:hypothetical protein
VAVEARPEGIAELVDRLSVAGILPVVRGGEEFVAVNASAILRRAGTPALGAHGARGLGLARQDGFE